MAASNLYEELRDTLQEFKTFLDTNVPVIKPAIQALTTLIPQLGELIDKLIGLMDDLKAKIETLNVNTIPGLAEASNFTTQVTSFLQAAKNLLPDQSQEIDEVLSIASVVTGLPSLDQIKGEILQLIGQIKTHLSSLKS